MTRTIEGKSRQEVLNLMRRLAVEAIKRDSGRIEKRIWDICYDWNSTHEDEIFMCEDWDEDDNYRFYIEDDYYQYEA